MAGIWGVIERGGRPGARVGLHEQLNVIRPRPSGSSWVIDNPAALLPGPRHQTGGGRGGGAERGDPALLGPALPFSPATPTVPGRSPATCPPPCPEVSSLLALQVQQGRGGHRREVVAGSPPERGRSVRRSGASGGSRGSCDRSGTGSLEPGKRE